VNAPEALERAIECAERGDIARGTLWLGIARELREGTRRPLASGGIIRKSSEPEWRREGLAWQRNESSRPDACYCVAEPGGHDAGSLPGCRPGEVAPLVPEPAYRRAETEVIRRTQDEQTPAYEAAGETLGDTVSIPVTIAHPQGNSLGPNSTCVNCGDDVFWERGSGWLHDQGGSARCRTGQGI
jgi:hypothetical protein